MGGASSHKSEAHDSGSSSGATPSARLSPWLYVSDVCGARRIHERARSRVARALAFTAVARSRMTWPLHILCTESFGTAWMAPPGPCDAIGAGKRPRGCGAPQTLPWRP